MLGNPVSGDVDHSRRLDSLFQLSHRHVDDLHHFAIRRRDHLEASIWHYFMDRSGHGLTAPNQTGDAYMAVVHLRPRRARDMWRDDRHFVIPRQAAGALTIHDLRRSLVFDLQDPFQTVNFQIPRWLLNEVADDADLPRIETLTRAMAIESDEVMRCLALALMPSLKQPADENRLFVDQLFGSIALHLIRRYGDAPRPIRRQPGGLAPWQERRVKEMLLADVGKDWALADLARECRLSVAHFSRAFKVSMTVAPHRWLTEQRLIVAKHLLEHTRDPLCDIALKVGYADQSHFTRVFSKMAGVSPGHWRQTHKI